MAVENHGVINDARNLRDYALLSGTVSADNLISALVPFELDPDLRDEEKLKQLQIEVASVARSIDPDTRHRVLAGQFRKIVSETGSDGKAVSVSRYAGLGMTWSDYTAGLFLVMVGFIALCLLGSYSMLAVRSSQWLTEFQQRGERDYVLEMKNLFEIVVAPDGGAAAESPGAEVGARDAQQSSLQSSLATYNFMASASRLRAMMTRDEALQREAFEIESRYYWCDLGGGDWPKVQEFSNALFSAKCGIRQPAAAAENPVEPALGNATTPAEMASLFALLQSTLASVNATRAEAMNAAVESRNSAALAAQQVGIVRTSLETAQRILYAMGKYPGGVPAKETTIANAVKAFSLETSNQWLSGVNALEARTDPRNYNTLLGVYENKLKRFLDIMNGWILPVLFGALGAIVLCLTRTASRFYATPSFFGILARLAVAMLGGALISIIFAPSYFAEGVKASSSFVFLLCFVFGYSTAAFVTLLDSIANKLAGTKV